MEPTVELVAKNPIANQVTDCRSCGLRSECGGLEYRTTLVGCFTPCVTECRHHSCDWTCPNNSPDIWNHRWGQVGGWPPVSAEKVAPLKSPSENLPFYIPQIDHWYRRQSTLSHPVVAIPTFAVVGRRRDGNYTACVSDGAELRHKFRLSPETRVLLVSVAPDHLLELYWRYRKSRKIVEALAALDIIGITSPNYTSFFDVPRPHNLWNRTRIVRVSEELSAAGLPIIPHLNATTELDWKYWAALLRSQPQIRYVCKEFQTGLARQDAGQFNLDQLSRLQDSVGRDLHPIVISAGRYAAQLARRFTHFSMVDSEPFMKTIKRRVIESCTETRVKWVRRETEFGAPLDAELQNNIHRYEEYLRHKINILPALGKSPNQLALLDIRK